MKLSPYIMYLIIIFFCPLKVYSDEYAILVEKQAHLLSVFRLNKDGSKSLVKSYPAITGKEQGDKNIRGDKRTPEGIYFVTKTKTKEELFSAYGKTAKKYGPLAFVLNYPNIFDEIQKKTGSGIWIHGIASDKRVLKPFDTEGCVALANKDVLELTEYIEYFQTPIVIVNDLKLYDLKKVFTQGSKYTPWLESWRSSWESSDQLTYENYYSDSFIGKNKNKSEWLAYKYQVSEITGKNLSIQLEEPIVIEFKDQLVVTFIQKYLSPIHSDMGRKFLYLQKENEQHKILSEEFYAAANGN